MTRLAFAGGILALGLAASTPARADWAVVKWPDGYCRIWWDTHSNPWGAGWSKIATAADWSMATAAMDAAVSNGTCR
jgi:hypothetical protein